MSLIKWNKKNGFPTIHSIFDDFFSEDGLFTAVSKGTSLPAANISETDNSYELEVAIPGKNKEDFKITIENNVLFIRSESEDSSETKEKNYTRQEYSYESFERSFRLPENAKEEEINANYEKGVLSIIIPKEEVSISKAKAITVG